MTSTFLRQFGTRCAITVGISSISYCLLEDETVCAPGSGILKQGIQVSSRKAAFCEAQEEGTKEEMYYNFPKRQKWEPSVEYPLWDKDWDGKEKEAGKVRGGEGGCWEEARGEDGWKRRGGVDNPSVCLHAL